MSPEPNAVQPRRGEIWDVDLDPTVGREQSGIRPALVISADGLNRSPRNLHLVLPITGTDRGFETHVQIEPPDAGLTKRSFAMVEQVRSVSRLRFIRRRGVLTDRAVLEQVGEILQLLLDF